MKCESCRKNDVEVTSILYRFKRWLMKQFFSEELIDFNQEKYMQGFGDGYKEGFKRNGWFLAEDAKKWVGSIGSN